MKTENSEKQTGIVDVVRKTEKIAAGASVALLGVGLLSQQSLPLAISLTVAVLDIALLEQDIASQLR